jgi:hypothetical protein
MVVLLCLWWVAGVWAQPAVGTGCSSALHTVLQASFSCTASGNDRLVLIGVSLYPGTDTVTAIAYGAGTPTQVTQVTHSSSGVRLELYRLIAPETGAQTVQVDYSGYQDTSVAVVPLTGAHQTTPLSASATAQGTSTTPSVNISSAATQRVVDFSVMFFVGVFPWTPGGGQTEILDFGDDNVGQSSTATSKLGAGTTTMTETFSSTGSDWLQWATSVAPAAAPATPAVTRRRFP